MRMMLIVSGLVIAVLSAASTVSAQPQSRATTAPAGDAALVFVAPFANLAGDPADDWIGVGIAEAIAIDLQMGGARVVRGPAGPDGPGPDGGLAAGRRAGADRMVNGAYQRLADRIRVTARLVDLATGAVLGSSTVTGEVADIFELQDRVAAGLRGADPAAVAAAAGPDAALGTPPRADAGLTGAEAGSEAPPRSQGPFGRPGPPMRAEAPPVRPEVPVAPPGGDAGAVGGAADTPAAGAGSPGAAGLPFAATGGLFVDPGLIDGPPAPEPPAVMTRDAEGRTTVRAIRLDQGIRLDGVLDEPVYESVPAITDFIQQVPDIGAPATERTEAWIMFDDTNVYVSARVHESVPERQWVANEMRRDTSQLRQNDTFTAFFDTFYDRRNGFNFYTNPLGARADQQFTNEGNPNADWNPVWDVRTGRFAGGWTVEMEIPFKTLRYRSEPPHVWGIQLRRAIRRKNEWVYLTRLPISAGGGSGSAGIFRVSAAGSLVGLEPPPASRNIEVKPYAIGGLTTDVNASPRLDNERSGDGGLDVKYGITQNLTADFTYNTDFAQVEVDERQVNLTRFPLFFPEKREFFLEGRGIFGFARGGVTGRFGGPGGGPVGGVFGDVNVPQLFYSRKIGLEQGRVVPIVGGARVTGKIGQFDVGALNIQAGDEKVSRSDATNFTVVRLRRDILRRSSVGALFTNRSVSRVAPGSSQAYGIDGTFAFFENLSLITYVARTKVPGPDHRDKDMSYQGTFEYAADRYGLKVDHLVVEDNFLPEVGFLRRDNFRRSYVTGRFSPRPQSIESVRQFSLEGSVDYILTADRNHLETRQNILAFQTEFESSDRLTFTAIDNYELLVRPFTPPGAGFSIPVGGYSFADAGISYSIGQQRRINGTVTVRRGAYFDGDLSTVELSQGRIAVLPQMSVEPTVSFNWVDTPYGKFQTNLAVTRVNYAFNPRMFFSGLLQYNSASDTFGSNLRLRWEYSPGSELFVVYTDDRDVAGGLRPDRGWDLRNRGFVVKFNRLFRF
jgi:TolB-like protein